MCRVLVRWKEKPRTLLDDKKHEATRSRRGDPIVAMDDGHAWGKEEGFPYYVSLDLEGVPKEQIRQFIVQDDSPIFSPNGKKFVMHKRAYNIDLDKLPKAVLDSLRRDGFASITWAQITGHIIHKRTGNTR